MWCFRYVTAAILISGKSNGDVNVRVTVTVTSPNHRINENMTVVDLFDFIKIFPQKNTKICFKNHLQFLKNYKK